MFRILQQNDWGRTSNTETTMLTTTPRKPKSPAASAVAPKAAKTNPNPLLVALSDDRNGVSISFGGKTLVVPRADLARLQEWLIEMDERFLKGI